MVVKDFNITWLEVLEKTLTRGVSRSPRGLLTKEVMNRTITVNMRRPVLTVELRALSYTFMLAEAHWILSGDNRVSTIAPYNKNIAKFSDDGIVFAGAYGPRIEEQLTYVVNCLLSDRDTRQAAITIWKGSPGVSKDVPCTMSIVFQIRDNKLHCSVFMRSSDIWLGLPYDVFNFSMLSHLVCCLINERTTETIEPGLLSLTAASSHIYKANFESADSVLSIDHPEYIQKDTPVDLYANSVSLMETLKGLRDQPPDQREVWWK